MAGLSKTIQFWGGILASAMDRGNQCGFRMGRSSLSLRQVAADFLLRHGHPVGIGHENGVTPLLERSRFRNSFGLGGRGLVDGARSGPVFPLTGSTVSARIKNGTSTPFGSGGSPFASLATAHTVRLARQCRQGWQRRSGAEVFEDDSRED